MKLHRREFLRLLGVSATTTVVFGSGIWIPRARPLVGKHYDFIIMDDVLSVASFSFQRFIEYVLEHPLTYSQKAMIEHLEANECRLIKIPGPMTP